MPGFKFPFFNCQRSAFGGHCRIGITRPVGAVHASEDRLQAVIFLLRDRVEFVIMAARAMDGQAQECGHGVHHHIVAIVVARDQAIGLAFRQFNMPDKIPRPGGDETGGHNAVGIARKQHVPGELLLDETRIGGVVVEGSNDVVAVRPGVGPRFVFVVTVGFAVVNHIQPVSRPAFAVTRRAQQAIDHGFVRIRAAVRNELLDLLRRRRQPGEIKAEPPDQRHAVGFRGRSELFGLQFGEHKVINWIAGPPRTLHHGNRGPNRWFKRPVIALGWRSCFPGPRQDAKQREEGQQDSGPDPLSANMGRR